SSHGRPARWPTSVLLDRAASGPAGAPSPAREGQRVAGPERTKGPSAPAVRASDVPARGREGGKGGARPRPRGTPRRQPGGARGGAGPMVPHGGLSTTNKLWPAQQTARSPARWFVPVVVTAGARAKLDNVVLPGVQAKCPAPLCACARNGTGGQAHDEAEP